MLLAKNLPSYFIPSDVIAVDTPVIMRQTMKISIPVIFTNYLFKMGLWDSLKPGLVALAGGAQNTRSDFWWTAFSHEFEAGGPKLETRKSENYADLQK